MSTRTTSVENRLSDVLGKSVAVSSGWGAVRAAIRQAREACAKAGRVAWIALDGYIGTDWDRILSEIATPDCHVIDMRKCLRRESSIGRLLRRSVPPGEPIFGRLYRGGLASFIDRERLSRLSQRARGSATVLVCGPGSILARPRGPWESVVYFDLTREEVLRRNRSWSRRKSKTQSISPRRIYYVDFPVHDAHRERCLARTDFYVDANDIRVPKILDRASLEVLVESLLRTPFRVKPLYEPGVWGGQWLIRRRRVPGGLVNCAYGLEIIAPEQSILVRVGSATVEIPFNLLLETAAELLLGSATYARFGAFFPVRISYDDTWEGGELSVQVHPGTRYMRSHFGEPLHQAEMYYIFEARPGSSSKLGLRDGIDPREFHRIAVESERRGNRFDHRRFVNSVPVAKGDILLIPPGTVHGAGADEVVLEISSTPYRYTFKIYDYRRPDIDGTFRPLSTEHAFNVVRCERTESWVRRNLLPAPRLLREGRGWKEFVIADSRFFHHTVHRIELERSYTDDTRGTFHILTLVEGDSVTIAPIHRAEASRPLALSESAIVPASLGAYRVVPSGKQPCRVVKSFPRPASGRST